MTVPDDVLDKTIVEKMVALGAGDEDFSDRLLIVQLMTMYLRHLSKTVEELKGYVRTSDSTSLERVVHGLKSSSRLIGLVKFSQDCQAFETIAHEKKTQHYPLWIARIEDKSKLVATVLADEIQRLGREYPIPPSA